MDRLSPNTPSIQGSIPHSSLGAQQNNGRDNRVNTTAQQALRAHSSNPSSLPPQAPLIPKKLTLLIGEHFRIVTDNGKDPLQTIQLLQSLYSGPQEDFTVKQFLERGFSSGIMTGVINQIVAREDINNEIKELFRQCLDKDAKDFIGNKIKEKLQKGILLKPLELLEEMTDFLANKLPSPKKESIKAELRSVFENGSMLEQIKSQLDPSLIFLKKIREEVNKLEMDDENKKLVLRAFAEQALEFFGETPLPDPRFSAEQQADNPAIAKVDLTANKTLGASSIPATPDLVDSNQVNKIIKNIQKKANSAPNKPTEIIIKETFFIAKLFIYLTSYGELFTPEQQTLFTSEIEKNTQKLVENIEKYQGKFPVSPKDLAIKWLEKIIENSKPNAADKEYLQDLFNNLENLDQEGSLHDKLASLEKQEIQILRNPQEFGIKVFSQPSIPTPPARSPSPDLTQRVKEIFREARAQVEARIITRLRPEYVEDLKQTLTQYIACTQKNPSTMEAIENGDLSLEEVTSGLLSAMEKTFFSPHLLPPFSLDKQPATDMIIDNPFINDPDKASIIKEVVKLKTVGIKESGPVASFTTIQGDGNCYYRGVLISILQQILEGPKELIEGRLTHLINRLEPLTENTQDCVDFITSLKKLNKLLNTSENSDKTSKKFFNWLSNSPKDDLAMVLLARRAASHELKKNLDTSFGEGAPTIREVLQTGTTPEQTLANIEKMQEYAEGPCVELGLLPRYLGCGSQDLILFPKKEGRQNLVFHKSERNPITSPLSDITPHLLNWPDHYDVYQTQQKESILSASNAQTMRERIDLTATQQPGKARATIVKEEFFKAIRDAYLSCLVRSGKITSYTKNYALQFSLPTIDNIPLFAQVRDWMREVLSSLQNRVVPLYHGPDLSPVIDSILKNQVMDETLDRELTELSEQYKTIISPPAQPLSLASSVPSASSQIQNSSNPLAQASDLSNVSNPESPPPLSVPIQTIQDRIQQRITNEPSKNRETIIKEEFLKDKMNVYLSALQQMGIVNLEQKQAALQSNLDLSLQACGTVASYLKTINQSDYVELLLRGELDTPEVMGKLESLDRLEEEMIQTPSSSPSDMRAGQSSSLARPVSPAVAIPSPAQEIANDPKIKNIVKRMGSEGLADTREIIKQEFFKAKINAYMDHFVTSSVMTAQDKRIFQQKLDEARNNNTLEGIITDPTNAEKRPQEIFSLCIKTLTNQTTLKTKIEELLIQFKGSDAFRDFSKQSDVLNKEENYYTTEFNKSMDLADRNTSIQSAISSGSLNEKELEQEIILQVEKSRQDQNKKPSFERTPRSILNILATDIGNAKTTERILNIQREGLVQSEGIKIDPIESYTCIRGDGDCYFRSIFISILTKTLEAPHSELRTAQLQHLLEKLQPFANITNTHPNLILKADISPNRRNYDQNISCKMFIDALQTVINNPDKTEEFLEKLSENNSQLDYGMIVLGRRAMIDTITKNLDNEFNGLSLRDAILPSYENGGGLDKFIKDVQTMGTCAEGAHVYLGLLPKYLGCGGQDLVIFSRGERDEPSLLQEPNTIASPLSTITPQLFFKPGHYDIYHTRKEPADASLR